jgi:hypothetical protein
MAFSAARIRAPGGNNEKINISQTIFAGQSAEAPVMWLDRKQLNNLNGKMKLNDLKKRAHWNFHDDEYEPPTHLSDDVVEPDQDTLHDVVDRYKSTKSFLMEYGRT